MPSPSGTITAAIAACCERHSAHRAARQHCLQFTEELHAFLEVDQIYVDVRFGKMLLDRGGLAGLTRANP